MTTQMNAPLNVPIRLDVAWSDGKTDLSQPMVDYTKLQLTVGGETTGIKLPWLGDTVATDPAMAPLPKGMHLHWTLPAGLRHGTTVYALDNVVCNELIQQGVPSALVSAIMDALTKGTILSLGEETSLDGMTAFLSGLCTTGAPSLTADSFSPWYSTSAPTTPPATPAQPIGWDSCFLEIYGPMVLHAAARMKLPPVPNRWLVVRTDPSNTTQSWVVESDRLTIPTAPLPEGDGLFTPVPGAGPIAVQGVFHSPASTGAPPRDPVMPGSKDWPIASGDTFRFLGLVTPATDWSEAAKAEVLTPFTAAGNGQPDFAAFYPNCQGVFGFCDASADSSTAYTYSVIGWFSASANDPASPDHAVFPWSVSSLADRLAHLAWALPENTDLSTIDGSLYTAAITATGSGCALAPPTACDPAAQVAIGNTAGEALAAQLVASAPSSDQTSAGGGAGFGLSGEAVLDAAQLGLLNAVTQADGPAIIANARHRQSFQAMPGGWLWEVVPSAARTGALGTNGPNAPIPVSDSVAQALNALNDAQMQFDRIQSWVTSQRGLLFTDWCRTLHLDTDAASIDFVASCASAGLSLLGASLSALSQSAWGVNAVNGVTPGDKTYMLPIRAGVALYRAQIKARQALSADMSSTAGGLTLVRRPAPPYWRPNDPVVLLSDPTTGGSLTATPGAGLPQTIVQGKAHLSCSVVTPDSGASPGCLPSGWAVGPSAGCVAAILAGLTPATGGPSWRPLLLRWQASVTPYTGAGTISVQPKTPTTPTTPAQSPSPPSPPSPSFTITVSPYDPSFVTAIFEPDPCGIDLIASPTSGPTLQTESALYDGRVVLNGHATGNMRARLLQLAGLEEATPPSTITDTGWPQALSPCADLLSQAYNSDTPTLSQSLDGFHDRLLMLRRIPQLSLFTPDSAALSLEADYMNSAWNGDSQSFYDQIGVHGIVSPQQTDLFSPIRAGYGTLTKLSLVDAFGQVQRWSLSTDNLVIAASLPKVTAQMQSAAPTFALPPRLAQPARLLFRWLTANGGDAVESPQGVAATPICGWVALNHADMTILVFEADGTLVGWISTTSGAFDAGPGVGQSAIKDPFLAQVATQMMGNAAQCFDDIATALLTIEPHAHRQTSARSTLVSRPLALARASLRLELLGAPAPHQGYEWLAPAAADPKAMTTESWCPLSATDTPAPASPFIQRETCGWTKVAWPVRLGDASVDNDGLVALWPIDATDGTIAPAYCVPGADPTGGSSADAIVSLTCAPEDAVLQLLMLLDPRASVHATTGILPTGALSIPPEVYAPALKAMEYVMSVGPVLTPPDHIRLPLPTDVPGLWNWVEDGQKTTTVITQGAAPTQTSPGFSGKSDDRAHPSAQPPVFRHGRLQANITEPST